MSLSSSGQVFDKMGCMGGQGKTEEDAPDCATGNHSLRGHASLPDEVWDVFRLDLGDVDDEPEPGDFWLEPDDPEPQ